MHRGRDLILSWLALIGLLLSACAQANVPTVTAPALPSATATDLPPTLAPTATLAPTDTPLPTPTEQVVESCVACHSDKEQLVANLKPVEEVESESKGVG